MKRHENNLRLAVTVTGALSVAMALSAPVHAQLPPGVRAVDLAAAGANNGTTWADAYTDVQPALDEAQGDPTITQIWVAAGMYIPTNPADPDDRTATYNLVNGVAMYGGFLGNAPGGSETELSQRDPVTNVTALAGGVNTSAPNRRYHVLTATDVSPPTRVDGFLISDGRANIEEGGPNAGIGGGLLARNANPLVIRCTFWHNKADLFGGGIYFDPPPLNPIFEIINCSFFDNLGDEDPSGGAIYNQGGRLGLTNCVLTGNKVVEDGGAIYNNDGTATFINCTFAGNFVEFGEGGGIFSTRAANTILTNCILWENLAPGPVTEAQITGPATVHFSCIQDEDPDDASIPFGGEANNNIDDNPLLCGSPFWGYLDDNADSKKVGLDPPYKM